MKITKNKRLNNLTTGLTVISIIFLILTIILFFVFLFNKAYFNFSGNIDVNLAAQFGSFFQGLVGTLAGITSALFMIVIFLLQTKQSRITQVENAYFKMLDYHRENVNSLHVSDFRMEKKNKATNEVFTYEGKRAFVIFKLQLFECLDFVDTVMKSEKLSLTPQQRIDIAYMIFYYGLDREYDDFTKGIFKNYPDSFVNKLFYNRNIYKKDHKIGRTNQTSLSSYFRNLYNAIVFIDQNQDLNQEQKKNYIKILRAQLSNPEQCLLYFNVMSRFGKKWKDYNLIQKYELIKNIPPNYCHGFDFRSDFKMNYEDDELDIEDIVVASEQ